jgi:hypothetical protein
MNPFSDVSHGIACGNRAAFGPITPASFVGLTGHLAGATRGGLLPTDPRLAASLDVTCAPNTVTALSPVMAEQVRDTETEEDEGGGLGNARGDGRLNKSPESHVESILHRSEGRGKRGKPPVRRPPGYGSPNNPSH